MSDLEKKKRAMYLAWGKCATKGKKKLAKCATATQVDA